MNWPSGVGPVDQVLFHVCLVALSDRGSLGCGEAGALLKFLDARFVARPAIVAQAICRTVCSVRKDESQIGHSARYQVKSYFSGQTHQANVQPLLTLHWGMSEKQTEQSSE